MYNLQKCTIFAMQYKYKYVKNIFMNKKLEKFIEKSQKKHKNRYNYSKVEYNDSQTKVCIICPEHGEFWQSPSAHVRGNGCPLCSNKKRGRKTVTTEGLIEKFKEIHGEKYDYSKVKYIDATTKVCITCPTHGDFYMLPFKHIEGQGCPKCKGRNLSQNELISKFKEIHSGKYDYSKVKFTRMKEKVCIICPEHGEFWQTPQKHIEGQGCPKCAYENKFLTKENFIKKEKEIHGNKFNLDGIEYVSYKSKLKLTCPIHGEFWQNTTNHLQGCGCPKCANNNSKQEQNIADFLEKELGLTIITKTKDIIPPYELDIYVPEKKIAIEYDGLRWHSELFGKKSDYHVMKTEMCEENGIHLVHIFEDEWINKKNIVKSRLKSIFGVIKNRIYARNCEIRDVTNTESTIFIENNHIQGNVNAKYRYGLYYNDKLVSIMTFGSKRKPLGSKTEDNCFELLRFCNKLDTNVIGGASKLLKHFINTHKPIELLSYCDRRWSDGNLYEKLGFTFEHISKPNYFYIVNGKRENRFKYRKSELVRQGYDKNKTEHEIMLERGLYRIYDCGTKVYKIKNPPNNRWD